MLETSFTSGVTHEINFVNVLFLCSKCRVNLPLQKSLNFKLTLQVNTQVACCKYRVASFSFQGNM